MFDGWEEVAIDGGKVNRNQERVHESMTCRKLSSSLYQTLRCLASSTLLIRKAD